MPDPGYLPPSVYQGMGWGPSGGMGAPPPDPSMPGGPPDFGGLPPSIPQGMGWAPPPDAAPMAPALPPTPTALPSEQERQQGQQPTGAPGSRDYQVPPSAFGAGIKPPSPTAPAKPAAAAPAKPPTFAQGMADLQQREAETEKAQTGAIEAGVEAQKGLHADQLAAYQQAQSAVADNAEQRKAEDDNFKKITATNTAKVDADRKAIQDWKFNRNKFMDELGVGGKIRWGIAQILAGIGMGMMRQAGNPVTDMLQQNIHDANAAQYKERDAMVEQLGFDRQTGQDAATYHATRQADLDKRDGLAYTALAKQLEEAAVKSADPIAQANGLKEAANVRAMGDERLKSYIQLQSQHDLTAQSNAIAGGHLVESIRHNKATEALAQKQRDIEAAKLLQAGKATEAKLVRERALGGELEPVRDDKGNVVGSKMGLVKMRDGSVFIPQGTEASVTKLQEQHAASAALVGTLDAIRRLGPEWLTNIANSDKKRQLDQLFGMAKTQATRALGLGVPTGKDIQLATDALGTEDPTKFRNQLAGINQARSSFVRVWNSALQSQGLDRDWDPVDTGVQQTPPTQTDEQRTLSDGLRNPINLLKDKPGKFNLEFGAPPESSGPGGSAMGDAQARAAQVAKAGGIIPSVKQAMTTWAAALQSPDMAIRRHYRQQLEKLANESESPETAAYAQKLLDQALDQQIGATPGAPEVTRGSAGAPR